MRKFFILIGALSIATFAVFDKPSLLTAEGKSILSFFKGGDDRFEETALKEEPAPIVTESRGLATGFQPEFKAFSPQLNIVSAHASVIMDADSGKILYSRNADQKRQVASLTKLFTATIAMERMKNLNELVTIDEEAVYSPGTRVG